MAKPLSEEHRKELGELVKRLQADAIRFFMQSGPTALQANGYTDAAHKLNTWLSQQPREEE